MKYKLKDICEIKSGDFIHRNKQSNSYSYPVYNGGITNTGYYNQYNFDENSIVISSRGANASYINKVETKFWAGNSCYVIRPKENIYWKYIYYYLKSIEKELLKSVNNATIPSISKASIEKIEINIPDYNRQVEIVDKIEQYEKLKEEIILNLKLEIKYRQEEFEYYLNEIIEK